MTPQQLLRAANQAWRLLDYDKLERLGVIDKLTHKRLEDAALMEREMEALAEMNEPETAGRFRSLENVHSRLWSLGSKAVEKALKKLKQASWDQRLAQTCPELVS